VVYEKNGYTLFAREQPLKRKGKTQTVYFFSKREPVVGVPVDVPDGYTVAIQAKTGVPYLKKR
jgi:hypothetical protein